MENYKEADWSAMSQFENDLDNLEAAYAEQFGEEKPSRYVDGKFCNYFKYPRPVGSTGIGASGARSNCSYLSLCDVFPLKILTS